MFVHRGGRADTEEGGRRGRGRIGAVLLLLEVHAATNEADDAAATAKAAKTSRHRDLEIVILISSHFHPFRVTSTYDLISIVLPLFVIVHRRFLLYYILCTFIGLKFEEQNLKK